jgi:hypothetical protein
MNKPTSTFQVGSSLVVVMVILASLMAMVGVAIDYTATTNRNVQRSNTLQQATAIADGTIDFAFGYWREMCRSQTNSAMSTSAFAALPTPSPGLFPNVPNCTVKAGTRFDNIDEFDGTKTISNYKIIAVDPQLNPYASANASPTPGVGQSGNDLTYNYVASADVTLPTLRGGVTTKLRRVFQKQQLSPWNYAIFYTDVLEIHPGPPFIVTGWVHTNGNLYTGHNTLTFADKVTYGSDWFVNWAPGDPRLPGGTTPETPTAPHYPANLPPANDVAHQPFGLDSSRIFNSSDSNPNNDSYHELIEQATAGYSDPLVDSSGKSQRYYDQASFKISVDATNNVTIRKADDTIINPPVSGPDGRSAQDRSDYTEIKAAISAGGSIQDNREQSPMRVTTVNIGSLLNSYNAGKLSTFNGSVIYVSTTSPSGSKPAVKLVNGAILPSNGLTVASNNPIYIKGDYNTGGANPPSNSGDPTKPQVDNYNGTGQPYPRPPSLVIGDAVNILSNAWNDSNSFSSLSSRVASNTTVNTAIVSGIVPTSNGIYSGGAENFPRFLENWTNKTFTYYGSMVELYQSQTANGQWVYGGNIYEAPIRQWYFDTKFRTKPPPGSLMVYTYAKGRWFTQ